MSGPLHRDRASELGLLALALIWGVNFSVIKVVLEELPPLAFNALRFPLAGLLLYLLLLLTRREVAHALPAREDIPRIVALGLLGHLLYQLLFIIGIDLTTAGNASLLLATTPIWTVLLSVVAGHERPPVAVWLGIVATVGGMTLVVLGGRSGSDGASPGSEASPHLLGDLLMLASSASWALYTVGGRKMVQRYGALPVTAWTLWIATPFLMVVGLPWLDAATVRTVSPEGWAGLLYAGGLGIALAYLLWYRGVRRLGSSRTAVYSNLVPVVALVVAWLWLREVPTVLQGLGAAVVLGGLTLTRIRRRAAPTDRPGPTAG